MNDERPQGTFIFDLNIADYVSLSSLITSGLALLILKQQYIYASLGLLFFAMLLDALNGYFARKFNVVRGFGIALDSFIDTLTYLIIPSLILFQAGANDFFSLICFFGLYIAGILRLSVFNNIQINDQQGKKTYSGLPVFWTLHITGLILLTNYFDLDIIKYAVWVFIPITSFLMLYNREWIKFQNMKFIGINSSFLGVLFVILELLHN